MPKKKSEIPPAEQLRRFREAANKAGVTDDEDKFKRAFQRVAKKPKRRQTSKET